MSILEVMFAILVTTVGLLGAIAIFPVASAQARKGRVNDAMSAAARTALAEFDARGMRRPDRWIVYHSTNFNDLSPFSRNGSTNAQRSPSAEFQRYLADALDGTLTDDNGRNWFGGVDSFCIDPRLLAAPLNASSTLARRFPAALVQSAYSTPGRQYGMWRVTLDQMNVSSDRVITTGNPLPKPLADSIFMFDDDLAYGRPGIEEVSGVASDRSLPAIQLAEYFSASPTDVAKRQTEGHFSWMATLTPKLDRASNETNDLFVLSIIVFYDRPADLEAANPRHERVLPVQEFSGGGFGGGEVLLTASNITTVTPNISGEDLLHIRPNDWICLMGEVQRTLGAGATLAVPVFKWYRVSDCEAEATDLGGGNWQRYVTLLGQDWDVPAKLPDGTQLTRAIYVEGVVGVYEKTVRLETGESL